MHRVVLAVWLLLAPGACMYMVQPSPPTPVRVLLLSGGGLCSAVVTSPTRAYTAGHCLDSSMTLDGLPARGAWAGPDLALLTGQFRGPYARLGGSVSQRLLIEGYGCNRRGETRQALLQAYRPGQPAWGGLEIEFMGQVCHGDSGGAVWSLDRGLVGVLTAQGVLDKARGFGTPVEPIPDLSGFLREPESQGP